MKRLRLSLPSPALVISIIALIVAMGGTGYAALKLPKNSVGTKQLKKNAVTGSKVKNSSLTGSDIKNGSLSGSDLKLSSLGTVPSATNATNAANATSAAHAAAADTATVAGDVKYLHHFDFTTGANAPGGADIVTIGPFTLRALCDINNAGTDNAELDITTTEAHSAFDASPEVDDFSPGPPQMFRQSTAATGTTNIEFSSTLGGAYAPDGTFFYGLFPVHVNPPGQVGKCEFQGTYNTNA
jgi:hypothetical protein